jgi:hypothetical protein
MNGIGLTTQKEVKLADVKVFFVIFYAYRNPTNEK